LNLRIVSTGDQSDTIFVPALNESYHSSHGAVQESMHVFIEAGLSHLDPATGTINVLEVGFGTGLNALLTLLEAERQGKKFEYTAIEAYPLERGLWRQLNYPDMLCTPGHKDIYEKLHLAPWGKPEEITNLFRLHKIHNRLEEYSPPVETFDLVYFDAFSPSTQPELWTKEIFLKLFLSMKPGAILTTYSVKGDVIRALRASGFIVEKIPGPPGKRQITRAVKHT